MDGKSAFRHGPKGSAQAGGQAAGSLGGGHSAAEIVLVKNDGGASYPCTFTYSLFPIGASVSDSTQRFAGATTITPYFTGHRDGAMTAAADGSFGLASYIGGTWYLWCVKETPLTRTC